MRSSGSHTQARAFARRLIGRGPRRTAAALLVLGLVLVASAALAQCPMCGQAAEQAGASPAAARRTLLQGVFLLLVPAFTILGGIAALVMRYHRAERERAEHGDLAAR